ncbi:MAG TPA: hypothetical protein VFV33_09580, partial [Gemmatimonadaceae bacterium]|nr:hypothetical protein [Gemmatimonadaceae bacterium]
MSRPRLLTLLACAVLLILLAAAGRTLAFHVLPVEWTGEAGRLAEVLQLVPGAVVADIGAGDGEMAVALAGAVGSHGVIYATEMTPEQRAAIAGAAREAGAAQVRVVTAQARGT